MRRRQKKVLSLVLCVAMMLSVMVVGAGAAFSDQSKIKNTEAVDACTALNIIGGYPDGSFKPEGNITRAEVTKMICVALNGGKEPNLATNATPTFSDVRTNANSAWAEKYIESCYAQGIVSGVGGGKFAPAGNVTGTQLAKMLLVSLGYNPDIEKFTGNAWATNVNIIATQKGLYEGLESIDVSAALTRDNAAQMIWNALKAGEVKYEYTLVSENGTLVSKTTLENKKGTDGKDLTMLKDKYSVTTREDVTLKTISKDDKGTYSVTTSGTSDDVSYTKVEKNYSDLMGQKVDVLVKDNDNSKVFGIYANEDSTVVATGVVGDLDTMNGSTEKVKFNDVEYKLDTNNSVITFNKTASYARDLRTLAANASGAEKAYAIKLIDNDSNGKIDTAVVTPFTVAEVTYAGSSSYTFRPVGGKLTTIGNIDSDDVNAYKGIAKDDYAIVYADTDTVSGDWEVVQADKVTGKVTATKSSDTKGKIDGKWYESLVAGQTFSLNDTVDAYIAGGYAFQVEVSESGATSADAVFVDAVEVNTTGLNIGLKAKLYFTDGTSKEAKISKVDNKKVVTSSTTETDEVYYANDDAAKSALQNKIFTYSMDGDKYELKSITSSNKCGYKGVETITKYDDKNLYYASSSTMKISDDAVLFVKGNDDTKVMTGKQINAWGNVLKNAKNTSQVMYSESNGFKYAKVGALVLNNVDIPDASGDTAYGYLTSDLESTKEGSTNYYSFTMWTEKGEKTVRAKTSEVTRPEDIEKGDFITYNIGDGETVSDVKEITTYGAVTAYAQGSVDINLVKADGSSIDNFKNKLADNAKIIYVNTKDKKGVEGGSITVAADDSNGVKIANVVYVIAAAGDDDANKITWLFVDTNNDLEKVANPVDANKADIINTTKGSVFAGIEKYASLDATASVTTNNNIVITGTAKNIASEKNVPGFTADGKTMSETYKGNESYPNVKGSDKFAVVYVKDLDLLLLVGDKEATTAKTTVNGTEYAIDISGLTW